MLPPTPNLSVMYIQQVAAKDMLVRLPVRESAAAVPDLEEPAESTDGTQQVCIRLRLCTVPWSGVGGGIARSSWRWSYHWPL